MNGKADRLPDGFDKRVREPYTVAELEEIFSTVDVNARGGYSEEPAISMRAVDLAGATWLLDHGADLEALSRFQKAPLAARAGHRSPRIVALLIQRGATVDAHPSSGETALQVAAKQLDLESVEVLLDAGADPRNSFGYRGDNALDCAAFGVTEHGGERALRVVRRLLETGARLGERPVGHLRSTLRQARKWQLRNGDLAASVAALEEVLELLGVEKPEPPRVLGADEPITVTEKTWQKRYAELWDLLVPAGGPAATVQGEVIRIIGRVGDELLRNGGANWDADHEAMLDAFEAHTRSGQVLTDPARKKADAAIATLRGGRMDKKAIDELTKLSVTWVLANPAQAPLGEHGYDR